MLLPFTEPPAMFKEGIYDDVDPMIALKRKEDKIHTYRILHLTTVKYYGIWAYLSGNVNNDLQIFQDPGSIPGHIFYIEFNALGGLSNFIFTDLNDWTEVVQFGNNLPVECVEYIARENRNMNISFIERDIFKKILDDLGGGHTGVSLRVH